MKKVVITQAARTPWGVPGGTLEPLMSSDMAAPMLKALLERGGVEPTDVDQVIFGQAHPSTMPNNIGHYAWLKAELPVEVPGHTVQINTASALQAMRSAYYLIATGNENICIAGGADSYSAAPFVMRDVRNHFYPQHRVVIDSIVEAEECTQPQPMSRKAQYEKAYGEGEPPEAAEYRKASAERAAAYAEKAAAQIVPMSYTVRKKGEIIIDKDEWLTKGVGEEPLAPYADGAAALLIMSEEKAGEKGLKPLAELQGFAVVGADPTAPQETGAAAVQKLLKNKGLTLADVAVVEIIENSAQDVLHVMEQLGEGPAVNPVGGALTFGKNDGAEGIFMVMRLMDALQPGQKGVACIYSPGGMGMAALIEKI